MYKIVPPKILTMALFFHICKIAVKITAANAQSMEGSSESGAGLLNIMSVVLPLRQAMKSTAIERAGMNFSIKEKNAGVFLFAKMMKGSRRRVSISIPMARVAITASLSVNFIFTYASLKAS